MDFKRRLGLLGAQPPVGQAESVGAEPASPPLEPITPASSAGADASVLEQLRDRMAAILGRSREAPSRHIVDLERSELPFHQEATPQGARFRRLERLAPSRRVGRVTVDTAWSAQSQVLALLALDPELAAIDPGGALYFDTETTGLGGAGSVAFLVGTCWRDGNDSILEQVLLRQPGEERPLLERLREQIERATVLVSYNGKAFDWPLLQTRCVMNRLAPLPTRPHLDLLHLARRIHRQRLGSCRLTSLESDVLGFVRGEDIDGAEVPGRYTHFLRTGDTEALRVVIDHNAWDVLSMAALVGLYGEPLGSLHGVDLAALARTYRRAGALEAAAEAADCAVARGGGAPALRVRGDIARARGERLAALRDFEQLAADFDDASARLALAKLYEHHVRDPVRALEMTLLGTGETTEARARRQRRLEARIERSRGPGRRS